jgi:hypothetical protein
MTDEGGLQLVEVIVWDPWLADPQDPQELQEGEVTVSTARHTHPRLDRSEAFPSGQNWLQLHYDILHDVMVRMYTGCIKTFC